MATARMAISSVLGTVTDTATAVSSIVSTISDGTGMLHDYVKDARRVQQDRMILNKDDSRVRLVEERAKENVQRKMDIIEWCGESTVKQEYFNEEITRLNKLFTN